MKHSLRYSMAILALAAGFASAATITFTFEPAGTGRVDVWVHGNPVVPVEDTNADGSETFTVADGATFSLYFYNISPTEIVRTVFRDGVALHNPPAVTLPPAFLANGGVAAADLSISADTTFAFSYLEPVPPGQDVPTGTFDLTAPTDGSATPITTASGIYRGPFGPRRYAFDAATDELGKMIGLGTIEGISATLPAPSSRVTTSEVADLPFAGALATGKDGKPLIKIKSSIEGQLDNVELKSSLKSEARFGEDGILENSLSGSAQRAGSKQTFKGLQVGVSSPPGAEAKSWSLQLELTRETVRGKSVNMAGALLTLPGGEEIRFPKRAVRYSPAKGYKLRLSGGQRLDENGAPILDAKGKPLADKKSKLEFVGLKLTKTNGEWEITEGRILYAFLGQKGSGNILDFN